MTSTVTKLASGEVLRPPRILVPLIKTDLKQAKEAEAEAGKPYYIAAGEKMAEAKVQLKHGEWGSWLRRNFKIGETQAKLYMRAARATVDGENDAQGDKPQSLHQYRLSRGERQTVYPKPWLADVKASVDQAKRDMERVREESLNRQQERDAERTLAMRLIDIGFKVLAKELHPDKGGSRDAMGRLNRVRDRLKGCA